MSLGVMETEPKWYVLHTFTNYENIAKENLKLVIENFGLHDRIFDIVIPMKDVIEEKSDGRKVVVSKKVLPSYIFIKMIYGDDIWHAITRTRGVTGFAGPKGRPLPLTEEEIKRMRLEVVECDDVNVGDTVEITNELFFGRIGKVISVNKEQKTAEVSVEMFGADKPIDLPFTDFTKVKN